jgi:hypothetical protein
VRTDGAASSADVLENVVSDVRIVQPLEREIRINATASSPLGKVVHDQRGNAIWDWAIETGVLATATAAELLRSLADPIPFALELDADRAMGWCGDPYNRPR